MENKLKQIRESKNMSQNEVAQALHISRQSLSKWENCRSNPDIENLVALSKLYDVSINELIDGIELPYQEKTESNNTVNIDVLKMLCYFSIVILSTFISVIGIGVSLFLLLKLRKQSYPKLFYSTPEPRILPSSIGGGMNWRSIRRSFFFLQTY